MEIDFIFIYGWGQAATVTVECWHHFSFRCLLHEKKPQNTHFYFHAVLMKSYGFNIVYFVVRVCLVTGV